MNDAFAILPDSGEVIDLGSRTLALPGLVSRVGLSLPDGLPFGEWQSLGETLGGIDGSISWWIGDWWAYGETRYGRRKAIVEAEDWGGPSFQTCMNAAAVARAFQTSRRREVLPWSHHAEVAALEMEHQELLLDAAEKNGWTHKQLRLERNRLKNCRDAPTSENSSCTVSDLETLISRGHRFGTIYADPPWLYDNQGTRAATGNHYEGLTVEELCDLPIADLAADDAHLHLWTTNGFLFDCPRIFAAWGFEFRSSFVWVKPQIGIGNYWRNSHEFLLTAIRGDAKRFDDKSLKSWLECDRGAHSAKPDQVRHMLERASPGPRLELFGRSPADGWAVWGNQIERGLFHGTIPEMVAAE